MTKFMRRQGKMLIIINKLYIKWNPLMTSCHVAIVWRCTTLISCLSILHNVKPSKVPHPIQIFHPIQNPHSVQIHHPCQYSHLGAGKHIKIHTHLYPSLPFQRHNNDRNLISKTKTKTDTNRLHNSFFTISMFLNKY